MLSTEALQSKIYLRTSSRGILYSDNNHFKIDFLMQTNLFWKENRFSEGNLVFWKVKITTLQYILIFATS